MKLILFLISFAFSVLGPIHASTLKAEHHFDAEGRLAHYVEPNGLILSYTYDEMGGLKTVKSNDDQIDYFFVWDKNGQLSEAVDLKNHISTQRVYDKDGQLIKEILTDSEGEWHYDPLSREVEITHWLSEGKKIAWDTFVKINQKLAEWRHLINEFNGMNWLHKKAEEKITQYLGKSFLITFGYYKPEGTQGTYGDKEIHPKVRVSFNNGITNILTDFTDNLNQISGSHGGVAIHYVYRPTLGICWDLLKSSLVKFGYVSPEAYKLLELWREMIADMGGIEGGGKIIHYAHSAGGTDTLRALRMMSDEEQKMLDIRTFGSPTLIREIGTYKAVNYVSRRDGVSGFDPIHYLQACASSDTNIIFVGTNWGIPFVDHPLASDSYKSAIINLGQDFIDTYLEK